MATQQEQIVNALAGFSAGVGGNLPQFLAQKQATQRQALQDQEALDQKRRETVFRDSFTALNLAEQGDFQGVAALGQARLKESERFPNADFSDTARLTSLAARAAQGDSAAEKSIITELKRNVTLGQGLGILDTPKAVSELDKARTDEIRARLKRDKSGKGGPKSGEQRAFEAKLANLTPEQQKQAILIDLGINERAVGSGIQNIARKGTASSIGDAEATIAQKKKFAELTGASRAKTIDSGFNRIVKIDAGIRGIDRAILALQGGANTGAIQKFLPSIKAASVELDQIKNELALDVIGGVTLGAISATELDLVKQVALPTGLDGEELIAHLEARRAAQQKLRGYFQEQINFLDGGGTVAGFLRSKEQEQGDAGTEIQGVVASDQQGNGFGDTSDDDLLTF